MRKYGTSDDQQLNPEEVEDDPQGISRTAAAPARWTEGDTRALAEENSDQSIGRHRADEE